MKDTDTAHDWPVDENGQKVKAAQLLFAKNPIELDITQNLLRAYDIPSFANVPNQGFFSTVVFGSPLLGATVYVPEIYLDEAKALMDAQVEDDTVPEDIEPTL